jgi:hypothetical protein
MGENAVVALRDFIADLDGVSDGTVMSKEGCGKMDSIVSSLVCDMAMSHSPWILYLLTVCPTTHGGESTWVFFRMISGGQSKYCLHITCRWTWDQTAAERDVASLDLAMANTKSQERMGVGRFGSPKT